MATAQAEPRSLFGRLWDWLMWTPPQVRASIPYEGASQTRRAKGWNAPTVGPNSGVIGNLATLRDRSRSAVRNDSYGGGAIDKLVASLIGTGIQPLSKAPDRGFRKAVQELWLDWTDFSDADGRLDFYGQQSLAARSWLEGGELFIRFRPRLPEDGLPVPLQVQLVEPELCPHTYNGANGENRIRAGIEFTPFGARAAYYMYLQRLGDLQDMDVSTLVRVPADSVAHLYVPARAGQIRGIPHLTRVLIKLHELEQFDDATLVRQKLANLFAAFLRTPAAGSEAGINPMTGAAIETENDQALVGLEPGIIQELAPGQEVDWNKPPDAGNMYEPFMRQQLMGVAAGIRIPYELLVGDLREISDRSLRVIISDYRRGIEQTQHQILVFQFFRPTWNVWFDRAVLSGALDVPSDYYENPGPYRRVRWVGQGFPYIHPEQDVDANIKAIRGGIRSRKDVVSELGEDIETVDQEIAEDNARTDELGLKLDSDPRKTDRAGKELPAQQPTDQQGPGSA